MTEVFEQQLAAIVSEYEQALASSEHSDASDFLSRTQVYDMRTRCVSAIERASGPTSSYCRSVEEFRKISTSSYDYLSIEIGIARALLSDIRNGYMKSAEELLHSNLFDDYLEMSMHLLDSDYKDAAAVLAGGTLEVHLKNMCSKYGISTERNGKAKKADELNAELAKQKVYSKLDQKSVTAWLGLRNDAAHGNYSAYTKDQVSLLLQGVRDFITRHPA